MTFRLALMCGVLLALVIGGPAANAAELPVEPAKAATQEKAKPPLSVRIKRGLKSMSANPTGCPFMMGYFCCIPYQPDGTPCTCGIRGYAFNNPNVCN